MKTKSEEVFEKFLQENHLEFEKIKEESSPRPDYRVKVGDPLLMFAVKALEEDENFKIEPLKVSSRIVGDHIRKKINSARKQIQFAAKQGIPSILLVYNNIDPWHLFATESHDFITAMYGEYTLLLKKDSRTIVDSFQGRNRSLAENHSTSFSAVGRLSPELGPPAANVGKITVTLFENVFSKVKIPYEKLPPCFDVKRINLSESQPWTK